MLIKAFAIAFSMYSIIPMPQVEWDERNMRYLMCFFPLVGLVIGAVSLGWLWLCATAGIGAMLMGAVAAAVSPVLSGCIHLDGFCDTCDALASHAPRDKKLDILKDSNVGAFAVIGCCLYFLLSFGVWSDYRFQPSTALALACSFVLSRSLGGYSVVKLRRARKDGLAAAFAQAASKATKRVRAVLLCFALLSAGTMILLSPLAGTLAVGAAALLFGYHVWMSYKQFGGVTGDLAGHFIMLSELAMAVAVVLSGYLH